MPRLIIARREGEMIDMLMPDGREITVTFLRRVGGRQRVAIDAPADVEIHRREPNAIAGGEDGPRQGGRPVGFSRQP